ERASAGTPQTAAPEVATTPSASAPVPSAGNPDLPPTLGAFPAPGSSFTGGAPVDVPPIETSATPTSTPAAPSSPEDASGAAAPTPGPGEFTQAFLAASAGGPSGGLFGGASGAVEPD